MLIAPVLLLIALVLVALAKSSSGADFMGDNIISDDPSDAASTSACIV